MKATIKIGKNGTNSFFIKCDLTNITEAGRKIDTPEQLKNFLELLLTKNKYTITDIEIEEDKQ